MSISSEEESESESLLAWKGWAPWGLRFGGGPAGAGGRIVIAIVGGLQVGTAMCEGVVVVKVDVAIAVVVVCCAELQSNPN